MSRHASATARALLVAAGRGAAAGRLHPGGSGAAERGRGLPRASPRRPVADADVAPHGGHGAAGVLARPVPRRVRPSLARHHAGSSRCTPATAGCRACGRPPTWQGQAFYCPSADAVVWDADGLSPRSCGPTGPTGVLVVLAHEVGHAVQSRLGLDALQARQPSRYPTILLEAMADCDAGVALAHFAQQPAAGPRARRRRARPGDVGADRLQGPARRRARRCRSATATRSTACRRSRTATTASAAACAAMTINNRAFTQRAFGSRADAARRGNLPVDAAARRRRSRRSAGVRPVRGGRGPARVAAADAAHHRGPVRGRPAGPGGVVPGGQRGRRSTATAVAQLEDRVRRFRGRRAHRQPLRARRAAGADAERPRRRGDLPGGRLHRAAC